MPILVVPETASTQDDLLRAVADRADEWPHLSGLRAEQQHRGRGRSGREWNTAGVRALTVSYVLRPVAPVETWGTIALRAGLAVINALAARGIETRLKWPNDIVIHSSDDVPGWYGIKKVGGILGTVGSDSEGAPVCIVGIGLNLEGDVAVPSGASLGTDADASDLAHEIRAELARAIPAGAPELPEIGAAVASRCHTLGKRVAVLFPEGAEPREITGTAARIDPDGALVVETSTGVRRILNGDIAHTRLQAPLG